MKYCYTCNKQLRRNEMTDKPVACSKLCKTSIFIQKLSDWRLTNRGYPSGYSSKSQYDRAVIRDELHNNKCIECSVDFLGKINKKCCSLQCTEINRIKKIASTKELKYGNRAFNNREKSKLTCLDRYGAETPLGADSIKAKIRQTNIDRYGVDNPSKNQSVIDKISETHLRLFGVSNIFKRRDIIEAAWEQTLGHGITNPQQVPEINKRTHKTRQSRYKLTGAVPEVTSHQTCLLKYGHKTFFGSAAGKMSSDNLKERYGYSEVQVKEMFAKKDSVSYAYALKKASGDSNLADEIYKTRLIGIFPFVPGRGSRASLEVFVEVESYLISEYNIQPDDICVGDNDRAEWFIYDNEYKTLYMYDFTIKSKKIMIEYNGCYFHPKTRDENPIAWDREQRKIQLAEELGYTVIIVWDDIPASEIIKQINIRIDECLKIQN